MDCFPAGKGITDGYKQAAVKQVWLKKIRVVVSLIFLALTTLLFVDFERMGETPAATVLLYPQFVPSLLKFTQTLAWAATGFLAVLALTLLFGRVYCSMICPLGTLQDIVIRVAAKLRWPRRVKFLYQNPNDRLRYGVLALVAMSFLGGGALGLRLLDPFSNYGRIASDLFRPLYVAAHNGAGQLLETVGINGPIPLQWKAPSPVTLTISIVLLAGLLWLSATRGRLFCNTLCPVGALLGLVARFALFKIRIPKGACILCARCSINCKAGCIRLKTKEVDFSRCVACFNCITVCEAHGIGYARPAPVIFHPSPPTARSQDGKGVTRRTLLHGAALFLVVSIGLAHRAGIGATPRNRVPSTVVIPRHGPVAPPGAGSLARFNELCIACHLCVSACPYGVLQPAVLDYGLLGLLQPRMDYAAGYCSYECHRCGQICPTGAIRPLDLPTKQITQMGVARFIRDNCIVHTDHSRCGLCADYCPTKAVHLVPYQDGLTIPELTETLCVGCGSCENACPVRPYRAIYVDGHPVQKLAERPRAKPLGPEDQGEITF